MPLVSMKGMLRDALRNGRAVGAFNPVDYNSMRAIVRAAEREGAPVIVQTSVKTVKYWGPAALASWMRELADNSPVEVALHLDHCRDIDCISACIDHGWTSVMFDGSALPFEENREMTRKVIEMAGPAGVGVEAELGKIGGVEEDIHVDAWEASLADPEMSVEFCRDLDLAVFAPAIGTAHGVYRGEPRLAFDRLEQIARGTGLPIALHGGTGLSVDAFRRCMALGCAKVNISTQLKVAFIDGFCGYHRENPGDYEPLRVIEGQYRRMEEEVAEKIRLFAGSGGCDVGKEREA